MVLGDRSFFFFFCPTEGRTSENIAQRRTNCSLNIVWSIERSGGAEKMHLTSMWRKRDLTNVDPSTPQRDRFQGNFSQQLIFRACGYTRRMGFTFVLFNDVTLYDFTNERGSMYLVCDTWCLNYRFDRWYRRLGLSYFRVRRSITVISFFTLQLSKRPIYNFG